VPHNDATRARELERLYSDLFDAENRGVHGAATLFAAMALVGSSLIPGGRLALGIGMGGLGVGLLVRTLRRWFDARRFGRDARLVDARPMVPREPQDHRNGWFQLLAIPDDARAVVARVKRSWPRSSFAVDPRCVKTWYAPSSSIVISFDLTGEPVLGHVVVEPLPRAQLAQR